MSPTRSPEITRRKILQAAFAEFYQHGFQGGSLNRIVEAAQTTKGALFHHFEDKNDLGYAVVDEVIEPLLRKRWIEPLTDSANPVADLKRLFRQHIREDIETGYLVQGCPLNNLAQEMSPLDEGFRRRTDQTYALWRKCWTSSLTRSVKAGQLRKEVSPRQVATLLVAAQMGIWGSAKNSQSGELMRQAGKAVCAYLDSLQQ
jgi:AcrR family transcriptional regulator